MPFEPVQTPEALTGIAVLALSWVGLLRRRLQSQQPEKKTSGNNLNERRYHDLFENAEDMIYRHDLEGRVLSLHPAGRRLLGYTAEEVATLLLDHVLPRDQRAIISEQMRKMVVSGSRAVFEIDVMGKNGNRLTVEVSAWMVSDEGQPTAIEGIARDITQRKKTDAALKASEEINRTLFNSLPQRVFFKDQQSVFKRVNGPFAKDFGLLPEQLAGKSDMDFFPPELAEKYRADDQKVMEARQPVYLEERNVVNGKERVVEVIKAPVVDDRGELLGLLGVFTDITERKRAEEERQRMQAFLNSVVENLPVMVFIKNAKDLRFVMWNKAGQDLIGLSADALIGKNDYDLFSREDADAFTARDRECLSGRKLLEIPEEKIKTTRGGERLLRTRKIPIFDIQGQPMYLLGISEDITEQRKIELERETMNKQLMDASRAMGMAEVATGVLHNVGNVLNSINVSVTLLTERIKHSDVSNLARVSELLAEHQDDMVTYLTQDPRGRLIPNFITALSEQLHEEQQGLVSELNSLQNNVDHVKDIVATQQSYAKMSGVIETLDVVTLVEDALRMNTGALKRHQVRVVREFTENQRISIEKHKVLQILINLIRNAKYAMDENPEGEKVLKIRILRGASGGVRIEVSDSGVGISPEDLSRIFSHGFTTRKDGHGFGLHSGSMAAKEMGGSLTAHSEGRGRGATFVLELPLSREVLPA